MYDLQHQRLCPNDFVVNPFYMFQHFLDNLDPTLSTEFKEFFGDSSSSSERPVDIHEDVELSLEEVCQGCTKIVPIQRQVHEFTSLGKPVLQEYTSQFKVQVKSGWGNGTKLTYKQCGHHYFGHPPSNIVFHVKEKQHHAFKRQGDDLICEQSVCVSQLKPDGADTPMTVEYYDLFNKKKSVKVQSSHVTSENKIIVAGEGMPLKNEPTKRGNLIINITSYRQKDSWWKTLTKFMSENNTSVDPDTKNMVMAHSRM